MKPDAVVFVAAKGEVCVAEITVARMFAPAGPRVIEVERNPLNGLLPGKMPLVHTPRDAKPVNAFIGNCQSWTPREVTSPNLAETTQAVMVHVTMRTIAMNEQRRSDAQQVFVPLKTRHRAGEFGQLFLKRNRAIMITDDEMDMAVGQIVGQGAQPVHRSGERLALISERTPTEIENITVQDNHVGVTQVLADSIEPRLTTGSTSEKMQIGDDDSAALYFLGVDAHAKQNIPNLGL